jgi:hypothetical protein
MNAIFFLCQEKTPTLPFLKPLHKTSMTTPYTDTLLPQEDDDTRSDDSDSEGSLVDFIVKDESGDESEIEQVSDPPHEKPEHITLLEEFPYDKRLLEDDDSNGPRRSKRRRKAVTRYRDPEYDKLMFDDVDKDALVDSGSDKEDSESEFEGSSSDDSSVEETMEGDFPYDE